MKLKIQDMAHYMSYEEIIEALESDNVPLSLHLLLYIKSLTTQAES